MISADSTLCSVPTLRREDNDTTGIILVERHTHTTAKRI
jgi:hypothetical protein